VHGSGFVLRRREAKALPMSSDYGLTPKEAVDMLAILGRLYDA
jgi:hypothetical protein